jgi:predicted ATPase/DNA-binding CsgD family transcriptional regulator
MHRLLLDNRLVTLTGAGGAGKTRLAVELADQLINEFKDGVWYVDLAPVADAVVVPVTVARTLGLPDQPGRSPMETVLRFISDRKILLLLDNCEHLPDASGDAIMSLLNGCPELTVLTTSREPISVAGEVTWRVPSLSLDDEAIALFTDRAQRARPNFRAAGDDAAARVRALSLRQIADSLNDRFRLLTGGARNALRRQQTLRASVDWSHALLTEPERTLFRRLGVFMGGFDLDAAQAVATTTEAEQFQILDQLSLLVDKSLVIADDVSGAMRYRLLETMRQYALEKLSESGEADTVRDRHRDHYVGAAASLEDDDQRIVEWAEDEIDNLRAAHTWGLETSEFESALRLTSSLQRLWVTRGRMREGIAGFEMVFNDDRYRDADVAPAVWVRAVADQSILAGWTASPASLDRAQEALAAARELGNTALTAACLAACGALNYYSPDVARSYLAQAIDLARTSGDRSMLCHLLSYQGSANNIAGEPIASQVAGEQGRDVADAIGDAFMSRFCRIWIGISMGIRGDVSGGHRILQSVTAEARAADERMLMLFGLLGQGHSFAFQGEIAAALATAEIAFETTAAMGGFHEDAVYAMVAVTALASGDGAAAKAACESAMSHTVSQRVFYTRSVIPMTEALLGCGELVAARQWADDTASLTLGAHQLAVLVARAYVAMAQAEPDQAERDAHDALAIAADVGARYRVPEAFDMLARLACGDGNHRHATRLFGAAEAIRNSMLAARLTVFSEGYDAALAAAREELGQVEFDAAWAEGAALSTDESIAYAQRGRGERKRPASGWGSLTPTELNVVRLAAEGLGNKDIAERLFISPRTVQTHLTHVYAKLALTSRVQLVQEAARHT